jgi:hypothetical protein
MAVEVYRMAHLATVVPIVRETEQSAWMKHASVVLVLPTLTTLTGGVSRSRGKPNQHRFESGGFGSRIKA